MKKFFFLLLSALTSNYCFGQNLVPNSSFEEFLTCPDAVGEVDSIVNWSSFRWSPDYFNRCADSSSLASVPSNGWGSQQPSTGDAYCGFQTHFTTDFREALGCQLVVPLTVGTKYYLTFKTTRADGGYFGGYCATNKIGARFSTVSYNTSNQAPINNFAHVYTDSIITDSLNWIIVQGSIIADSAYRYLALGNFFDDAHTDILQLAPGALRAYYYVDDVCVSTDSGFCATWTNINEHLRSNEDNTFSIYPNPTSSVLYVKNNSVDAIQEMELINSTRQPVYSVFETDIMGSLFSFDVSHHPKGFYYLIIKTGNSMYFKKTVILN